MTRASFSSPAGNLEVSEQQRQPSPSLRIEAGALRRGSLEEKRRSS